MKIRSVCSSDAAAIAAIYNHYVQETVVSFETEPLSVAQMRARIKRIVAGYPYLVCEDAGGQVLGYACAHAWKERAAYCHTWEVSIYLHPEHCGQGLGAMLMAPLVQQCREAGAVVLIACITQENTRSIDFHRRWGFEQVSHFPRVGCKFGRMLDVVDLCLPLQ